MPKFSMNPTEMLAGSFRQLASGNGAALFAVTLLAFAAFGAHAFNMNLVADDWGALIIPDHQYLAQVRVGRWLQAVVWVLLDYKAFASSFTLAGLFGLNLLAGLIALKWLSIDGALNRFIFLGLLLFFPFWAEIYIFNQNHVAIGLATFLAVAAGVAGLRATRLILDVRARNRLLITTAWILLGALAFSLSASLNQALVPLSPMLAAGVALQSLLEGKGAPARKEALAAIALNAVVCGLGAVFYALEVAASRAVMSVDELGRGYAISGSLITSWSGFKESLIRLLHYFDSFLFGSHHLFPLFPKIIFLLAIGILVATVARVAFRQDGAAKKAGHAALAILLILGLILLPWVLGLLREQNTYRFRALTPAGMSYAAIIGITLTWIRLPLLKGMLQLAALASVLIFVLQQSIASNVNISNLTRDLAFATRLVERVESDPVYRQWDSKIPVSTYVVGRLELNRRRPFADLGSARYLNHSLVNCSIITCLPDQATQAMTLLHTGTFGFSPNWIPHKEGRLYDEIKDHLDDMLPWPDQSSVKVLPDNRLIILLTEPR
jgi:hypothetical protein